MMKGRLTLHLIVILVPCLAMAHSLRPVYVAVSFESETTVVVELQRPLLDGKLVDVSLTLNCERTTPVESQWTSAGMIDRWQADCGAAGLEHMVFAGLIPETPNAIVTLFSLDGEKQTYVVDSGSASLTLKSEAPGLPAYLWLGVEHLLLGFDHVLLVLGLMLLISNRWVLIQAVTSFTVAHSVTLALSSLSIIELPQASVEAVIALTLLYLAVEIASPERHQSLVSRYPWIIAFAFGLLHGLGFAGVLRDIGLPEDELVMSLFLFNVGIELGQLAVIAGALVLYYGLRNTAPVLKLSPTVTQNWRMLPTYLLGSISSFWVIDRLLSL